MTRFLVFLGIKVIQINL